MSGAFFNCLNKIHIECVCMCVFVFAARVQNVDHADALLSNTRIPNVVQSSERETGLKKKVQK